MFKDLFNKGYYTTNKKFNTPDEWIDYCAEFSDIKVYQDFWSCLPNTKDKVMLLGTEKINNRDCYVSRPGLLDWHYDGMGLINPEELLCLYCVIPNSVTLVCNLHQMYVEAPADIKKIIHNGVIEITDYNGIYDTNKKERVQVVRVHKDYEREQYKPLFQIHPISGKPSLVYANTFVKKLHGLTEADAKKFDEYYNKVFDKYVYRHHWKENDILIIDQRMCIHARTPYEGERKMWRTGGWYK